MVRLLVLLAVLLAPAAAARAAPQACGGRDLLAEKAVSDPAFAARLEAAAAGIENGGSAFWRIEPANGAPPSHLLGTMHVSDPRVLDLAPAARAALDGARVVALENTSVLDPSAARTAYADGLDSMIYRDGRTLAGVLGPERWRATARAVEARGLPGWAVMGWKPWVVTFAVLLYPPCEIRRWAAGADFLDIAIGKTARAARKPVVDLETVRDQFSAIDAMTESEQVALLGALVAVDDRIEDLQETMIRLYEQGRIDLLWASARVLLGGSGPDFTGSVLVNASFRRNVVMAANARPLIDGGNAFLAVGALHLVGEKGLVRLLREAGYRVTPVP